MNSLYPWIFASIGWVIAGGRGAVVGFILGLFFSVFSSKDTNKEKKSYNTSNYPNNGFMLSLVTLTAAVMNADGRIVKGELFYVRSFFHQQFGKSAAQEAMLMLRDILKKPLPLQQACYQMCAKTDYATRIQLLHYLFGIANAGGVANMQETNTIQLIANFLAISARDFISIKSAYIPTTSSYRAPNWAYQVLEVNESASNEEVKKAYRHMAIKHHPDKVSHLGEKQQKAADEKFKKINEAFEEIKKQRGIN